MTTANRLEVCPTSRQWASSCPGYEASGWFGVGAPRNTPADIVEKLNNTAVTDSKFKARLADLGGMPLIGSPADFGKLVAGETEKWGKVIRVGYIRRSEPGPP